MKAMCEFMRVSRSGYYSWKQRPSQSASDVELLARIRECAGKHRHCYGYRRVTKWLKREYDLTVNHKRVQRIMKENDLQAVIRRRRLSKSTLNGNLKYENVLNRNFTAEQPNQKWATDITYMKTPESVGYLSVIRDLCGDVIVGYEYGTNQRYELVQRTLQKAMSYAQPSDVILHSDQGTQYRSYCYLADAKANGITISMSRPGTPADNACVENFFSIFKTECLYLEKPANNDELFRLVDWYIPYYNNERITGNGLTPMEIREMAMQRAYALCPSTANLDNRPAGR